MAWDCSKYFDYLADRTPHWTEEILRDWFPIDDAWIGQIQSQPWGAFTGTTHIRDRMHMAAPDLTQGWTQFDTESMLTNHGLGDATTACLENPCSPPEICVGWGITRSTFDRWRTSYSTLPFCFDTINTRAMAKDQVGQIYTGLKDISQMVQADRHRYASAFFIDNIHLAGSALASVAVTAATFTGACTTMNLGGTPAAIGLTSELTVNYLQRFYEPLQSEGYFKSKYVPNGVFKLITDPITSQQLTNGNPALQQYFRFTDFQKGGELFKYGMSNGVGNFGITWDKFPMRFYFDSNAVIFRRVWPFINVAAGATGPNGEPGPSMGLKKIPNRQYQLAPYQLSQIWHPEALKRYTVSLASVHPEMPFLTRDLMGKWNFVGGNKDAMFMVTDPEDSTTTCTIDNKRHNRGAWWCDHEDGMEMQRPEIVRQILHLREPGCVANQVPCSTAPAYILQDYSGCLPLCQEA